VPTYQYSCTECGHFFEIAQSFSDDSLTVCPECEGRLRKVFNAVGVVFKGSGFYRTDSRAQADGQKNGQRDGKKSSEKVAATSETSSNGGSTNGSGEKASSTSGSSTSASSTSTPSPAA
jgi:putative FmdB family regulatory protein